MLGLIATLAVLSALIVVYGVFRPTEAERDRRSDAIAARGTEVFAVLGAFPSRAAIQSYTELISEAGRLGVTIDWDRARFDRSMTGEPKPTLVTVASQQI